MKGSSSKTKSKATIERDAQARVRRASRNSRSDAEQLALLEKRGAGSCKEAQRLRMRLGVGEEWAEAGPIKPRNRPARKRRAVPASLM